jgi:hypothetical protein
MGSNSDFMTSRGGQARSEESRRGKHRRTSDPHHAFLDRLAQDIQDVMSAPRQGIQQEHALVGERHLPRHGHVAPTDQPDIRDGVVGGPNAAGRDPRRAVAGEARYTVEARGLKRFSQGQGWQDGDEVACPPSYGHVNCAKRCWVSVMIPPTGMAPVPFHQVAWFKSGSPQTMAT